jgi:FMN-dependent NADH-azoreductase
MKKLMHIIATPRGKDSRTLKVSEEFIKTFKANHANWKIEETDLFKEKLPELTVKRVDGKYELLGGKDLSVESKGPWQEMIVHIEKFLSADAYLISTPMWNFSMPYRLKHYIDVIVQPKYLFQYTPTGAEGLAKNRKMVVITSRGGDYSTPEMKNYDLLEPYLRTVFSFVGITDITFINAQPMDALGSEVQQRKIKEAQKTAEDIASNF